MTGVVVGRCPCGGYGVVHDDEAQKATGLCHAPLGDDSFAQLDLSALAEDVAEVLREVWPGRNLDDYLTHAGSAALQRVRWRISGSPMLSRSAGEVMQDDMRELMEELGIPTHARFVSPHEVMQREIIPEVRDRTTRARFLVADIDHCLASPADVTPRAAALLKRALDELGVPPSTPGAP